VIDQGDDGGVNATSLRRIVSGTVGCAADTDTRNATVIQTRHRVPEEALGERQVVVYQVPVADPLRGVQKSAAECDRMHAEADYSAMWVSLYEDIVRNGVITMSTGYPVLVNGRYVMAPSPVPRWDVPRLHQSAHLNLYGAGRERRIYAVPPHTPVTPLTFDDVPFEVEHVAGARCGFCESDDTFLVEASGGRYVCSDSDYCARTAAGDSDTAAHRARAPLAWRPGPGIGPNVIPNGSGFLSPGPVARPGSARAPGRRRLDAEGGPRRQGVRRGRRGRRPRDRALLRDGGLAADRGHRRGVGRLLRRRARRGARADRRVGVRRVHGA
jgi:alpha-D-ribose 1-methylphosphonate 5-phosphate C-P lyase